MAEYASQLHINRRESTLTVFLPTTKIISIRTHKRTPMTEQCDQIVDIRIC